MNAPIIAGCVVLSVQCASSGAHARSYEAYHCGRQEIQLIFEKYFSTNRTDCSGGPCDGKSHYFVVKPADMSRRVDSV